MKDVNPEQLKPLSAAILSDIVDSLGLKRRAMRPFVRPLDEAQVMVGRARTGLYMPAYALRDGENPYEIEIALVDDLQPQEVVVLACNGPSERIAPWGELLTTADRCEVQRAVSPTAWCAMFDKSVPWVSRCSMAASGRWIPRAGPAWSSAMFEWSVAASA